MNKKEFYQNAVIQIFMGLHCVDRRPMKVEDEIEEAKSLAEALTEKMGFPGGSK